MRLIQVYSLAFPLLFSSITHTYAAECTAKSGAHTLPLLELYTSEGCSSCPPADKWLSNLDIDATKVTPLAFHVDYWNYIGWQDRFSKADYSNRQRKIATFNTTGFVYTPQFVLNGKDFRGWENGRLHQAIEKSKQTISPVQLQLDARTLSNGSIVLKAGASITDSSIAKRTDVFVALYENKLVSKVNAGENNGRELHHDYVVRELFGAYPITLNPFSQQFNLSQDWKYRDAGAVMFAQDKQTGEILQSLTLKLCGE